MGSHKIQTFSRIDIAIASKLLYLGKSFGYKRNMPENDQKFTNFLYFRERNLKNFVIFIEILRIWGTDPDPFGQKSTDSDPDPRNPD